jgi:curli production assembly/transport component CsgF
MMIERTVIPLLAIVLGSGLSADELIYEHTNPAFGGNALNGNWLLNNAQAQDTFKDPDQKSDDLAEESELDQFNEQLERIALSRLASELTRRFMDGELPTLETDNFLITSVTNDDGSTTITTTDKATGDKVEFILGLTPDLEVIP